MARTRVIGAASMRERQEPRRVADDAAHADYREMIDAEIGRPDFHAPGPADDGRPSSLLVLLFRPLSLLLLSVTVFAGVATYRLWRLGWFEQFRLHEATAAVASAPTTDWMAGRGVDPPIDDQVPLSKPATNQQSGPESDEEEAGADDNQ